MASLAKQIDKLVADNKEKKLAAVINFTGDPSDDYQSQISEFGEKHNIKNVSLTVTADGQRFNVSDDAEVTVILYKGKTVKFNCSVGEGKLDKAAVKAIVDGTGKILD